MFSDHDEDFSFDDDLEYSNSETSDTHQQERRYNIVAASDVISEMNKYIDRVNEIFKIKRSLVRRLLVHFKWNPERLIEKYYESQDNCEELFREAGLVYVPECTDTYRRQVSRNTINGTCMVCYTTNLETIGMLCKHYYCKICWNTYFTTQIMDNGVAENIQCMATECSTYVNEKFVLSTISRDKVRTRYYQLIARSYISSNLMLKVPHGRGNSAEVLSLDVKHILCSCGMEWCFGCGEPDHLPLESCQILKKWKQKAIDESETNKWLVINTKECPKCAAAIEKLGGCNHMTCNNRNCSFEFCWICLDLEAPHGSDWFSCNKYVEDADHIAMLSKERKAMERYHHYYDRYWTHKRSRELEQGGLVMFTQTKSEYIQDKLNVTWIEAQFLKESLNILTKCRTMLQYSYILAYYLVRSPQTVIFEENQKDLEHNTELLSGLLDDQSLPRSEDELLDLKMKLNNRAAYCEKRRIVLLKDVQTGYDKGIWKYRTIS
ncbi:LOW QUALITY PROTEIN: E3 ubiquitin-protein ligase ariadne-1-like [Bolinopsis microptera]|uniref:LOW QUALITY PROTEIN: E3 ubiquitin-protein ligase ariadne-1-like n=1 Tax=Bolinopsis microptera TaxID=2820187 RepID=UPI00307A0B3A